MKNWRMKMRKIYFFLLLSIHCSLFTNLFAAFEYYGRSAREEGMANIFVALADNSANLFLNPAGLSFLSRPEVLTSYGRLYCGLDDGKNLSVGYGKNSYTKINPVFAKGYKKSAFSIDLGFLYQGGKIDFGVSILNLNSPNLGLKYENKVSPLFKIGANLKKTNSNLGLEANYRKEKFSFSFGNEQFFFNQRLVLRGGIKFGSREYRVISLGMSYSDSWYKIDYAFIYPLTGISEILGTHKVDFVFYFGKKREVKKPVEAEIEGHRRRVRMEISAEDKQKALKLAKNAQEVMEKAKFAETEKLLRKAINLWPDNSMILELLNRIESITLLYPEISEKDKKTSLIKRAILAYLYNKGKKAVNRVRYAYQLWPNDLKVARLKTIIEGEFSEIAEQEKLIPGLNLVDQKLQQALEYIYDKKWVAAVSLCEEVLDLEPKNILALKRLGSAYFGMGNKKKAREIWQKALKINPKDEELRKYLGITEEKRERKIDKRTLREFKEAVTYYQKLVSQGASDKTRIKVLKKIICSKACFASLKAKPILLICFFITH